MVVLDVGKPPAAVPVTVCEHLYRSQCTSHTTLGGASPRAASEAHADVQR